MLGALVCWLIAEVFLSALCARRGIANAVKAISATKIFVGPRASGAPRMLCIAEEVMGARGCICCVVTRTVLQREAWGATVLNACVSVTALFLIS